MTGVQTCALPIWLFFWDQDYISTFLPILASLVLLDVGFNYLDWRISFIHVMRDNFTAIGYAQQIGYELCDGQDDEENQLYQLTQDNFEKKAKNIRRAAGAFVDEIYPNGYLLLEPEDYTSGLAQQIEYYFYSNNIHLTTLKTEEGTRYFR